MAKAFMAGLERGIREGADIIVNTDADNQYNAADIEKLVEPILQGRAEFVIGARPISQIETFSPIKKILQKLGSWVVRLASDTAIPDAPSGFRAITRSVAMRMRVFNDYTYTLETIIQAGRNGVAITSVPIRTNRDLRPSRLVKSIVSYVRRSLVTIVRIFMTYRPFKFFASIGSVIFLAGFFIAGRYLLFVFAGETSGHIQSLILSSLLMTLGFVTIIVAFLADLISVNRKLLEDLAWRSWCVEEKLQALQNTALKQK